jgi:hypothetical protein
MRPTPVLILMTVASGWAAEPESETPKPPPAYLPLRFNEDYSRLANPDVHIDAFDPLKYLRLRADDPTWYLSFGGELRERVEITSNPDFGLGGRRDGYLLQRITLEADLHLGERLRFYVEGISGLIWDEDSPPPPVQDDPADLQFAFMDLVPLLMGDQKLTVRFGRFGMSLGSGRLVATRAAPNIPFKFDGWELLYEASGWQAQAFLTRPGEERTNGFDLEDDNTTFWGAYLTHWFDAKKKSGLDLYYLGLARENSVYASGKANQHRHSTGFRSFGEAGAWDWNLEGILQFGSFGEDRIFAWTGSIDGGYSWKNAPWKPRLGLKFDVASGDRNPKDGRQETFDPLFFKSGYFNDASLLRPSNIIDVHPSVAFEPAPRLEVSGGVDVFWRYSTQDAIYNPPGFIAVLPTDNRSRYFGTALDVNVSWRVQRHALLSSSYVYFLTDNFIHSAGGGGVGFFSATVTLEF